MLPPLSGLYHVCADPSDGWAGLKKALASCPVGGSMLAKAGEYVYGPEDMTYGAGREGCWPWPRDVTQEEIED